MRSKITFLLMLIFLLSFCSLTGAQNVEYVGDLITNGYAYDVFVSGDYAYVTNRDSSGLQIIDISVPSNPTFAGSHNVPYGSYGLFVSESYAYVVNGSSGLQIIDVFDPTDPILIGNYDIDSYCTDVFVSDGHAYIVWLGIIDPWSGDYAGGVEIIDVSDPVNPIFAGSYDTPGGATDVVISGDYAYVTWFDFFDFFGGVEILDISNPTNPTFSGSYDLSGGAYDIFVSGDYAYLGWVENEGNTHFHILDVSEPASPEFMANYDLNSYCADLFVSENYSYIANWSSGLQIIDVTDPAFPALAGNYDTPGSASGVFVEGDYIYVTDTLSLIILRFNPETGIEEVGFLPHKITFAQNYPNPFNASTVIKYGLTKPSRISIEIYDILGQRVEVLTEENQEAGHHSVVWNANDKGSGLYFYKVQAGDYTETNKMVLLR